MNPHHTPETRSVRLTLWAKISCRNSVANGHFQASWASQCIGWLSVLSCMLMVTAPCILDIRHYDFSIGNTSSTGPDHKIQIKAYLL